MKKLVSHLSYSRVVSTLALFIALGGGAYALSLGKNDVKSRHIAKGAVKSSDVAKNTLKGSDVKQDSLKGSDILESTFDIGQFSAAASTPFDPAGPIRCDPELNSGPPFVPCGTVSLTTPVGGRVLAIGAGELIAASGTAIGSCRLFVDNAEVAGMPLRERGSHGFSLSGVSEGLLPGPHAAELRCTEFAGQVRAEVYGVTAMLVGG
jgi:hypothetical protein